MKPSGMKAFAEKTKQLITNRKGPNFDDDELTDSYIVQREIQSDLRRLLERLDTLSKAAEGGREYARAVHMCVLCVCLCTYALQCTRPRGAPY